MALPILNNASLHELTVQSTGKTYNYRPYLVKEEKILLQAKESNDDKLMMKSLIMFLKLHCRKSLNLSMKYGRAGSVIQQLSENGKIFRKKQKHI